MTKHSIVIVNGPARAGKDSFVEACMDHLGSYGISAWEFSSIRPVVDLLKAAGVDTSAKTEADRKLLADVGAALEEHSNFRTRACVEACLTSRQKSGSHGSATFLHIREPKNIIQVLRDLRFDGFDKMLTVFVDGPRSIAPKNVADESIRDFDYDHILMNDSTLEALGVAAGQFLQLRGIL